MIEYVLRGGYPLDRCEFDERMVETEKHLFSLGLCDTAEEVGRVNEKLLNVNIASHGGGNKLFDVKGAQKIILYPEVNVIIPRYKDKARIEAYADMETVFRSYRSEDVLKRC